MYLFFFFFFPVLLANVPVIGVSHRKSEEKSKIKKHVLHEQELFFWVVIINEICAGRRRFGFIKK